MCNSSGIGFVEKVLKEEDVKGRRVLEIGALNVNGSVRPSIERFGPAEYIGVDMVEGSGVDLVCRAEELAARFAPGRFDLVVSTEMLEHVRDWRRVISNMKALLEEGGILLITTRSFGFGYHAFPYDFWRFEAEDMRAIFSDLAVTDLESDPLDPGVFLKAVKKAAFVENDLEKYELYSVIKGKRAVTVTDIDCLITRLKYLSRRILSLILPEPIKRILRKALK